MLKFITYSSQFSAKFPQTFFLLLYWPITNILLCPQLNFMTHILIAVPYLVITISDWCSVLSWQILPDRATRNSTENVEDLCLREDSILSFEIFRNLTWNLQKSYLKSSEIFRNLTWNLQKSSEILLEIFRNLTWNLQKSYLKSSEILLEIFRNLTWNLQKSYLKSSEILLEIFRNLTWNLQKSNLHAGWRN